MKKIILAIVVMAAVLGSIFLLKDKAAAPSPKSKQTGSQAATPNPSPPAFDKQKYPIDSPGSMWVIVNKPLPLKPANYIPSDLVVPNVLQRVPGNESMQLSKAAAALLEQMFAAAKKDGVKLMLSSGYRSYTYQVGLYNGYVKSLGQAGADKISARPGHSEHQTGLAADIEPEDRSCEVDPCFADTPAGKWLAENAYKYGFIIRYPSDKVTVTGYDYEPWHVRYVGTDLAAEMHSSGTKTLEEFFGVPGGPNY